MIGGNNWKQGGSHYIQSSCSEEHLNQWKLEKALKDYPRKITLDLVWPWLSAIPSTPSAQLSCHTQVLPGFTLKQPQFCTQPTSFCLILLVLASCSGYSSNFFLTFFRSSSLTTPFSFWFNAYASPIFLLDSLLAES